MIKRNCHKYFAIILSGILTLTGTFTTFAKSEQGNFSEAITESSNIISESQEEALPETMNVIFNENNECLVVNEKDLKQNKIESEVLKLTLSKYAYIYESSDGAYYAYVSDEKMQKVNRIDVDLKSKKIDSVLKNLDLPKEPTDDLKNMYERVSAGEVSISDAIVFSPLNKVDEDERNVKYREDYEYLYNGTWIHDIYIYYDNISTNTMEIVRGYDAARIAAATSNGLFTLAGYASYVGPYITLIGTGRTLIENWISATGRTPLYGRYEDFVEARYVYDVCNKYTYVARPDFYTGNIVWAPGCTSQAVRMKQIDTHTYVMSTAYTGHSAFSYTYFQQIIKSPNFDTAYERAYYSVSSPWSETLIYYIKNTNHRIYF